MSARKLSLFLGCLLVIFSSLAIAWRFRLRGNPRLERFLCQFGICDNDALLERGFEQLGEGDEESVKGAVETFREALRRDPASAYRWCDLGEALRMAGQVEQAGYCISQALEHGPNIAPVLLRAAVFYFQVEQTRQGLECMYRVLEKTPDYDANVFSTYTRLGGGIDNILKYGLPALQRPAQAYFRHLLNQVLNQTEVSDVQKLWDWLTAHSLVDDKLAGEYVDFLLKNHEYPTAVEAWTFQLGERKGGYPETNELFNGSFETETTETTLDWKIRRAEGVEVTRDSSNAQQGRWSLRIRFEGKENLAYSHITQRAVVKPGPHRFEAWVRTEEITTDQGIGWRIFDAESASRLDVKTEQLVGTTKWTRLEKVFEVPVQTRLLEVQLCRRSSLKFDNKISGTAWIDAVSLRRDEIRETCQLRIADGEF